MSAKETKEVAVATEFNRNSIIIGQDTDLTGKSVQERFQILARLTEAQAGTQVDDSLIDTELTAVGMTVYQRDYVDQETGEIAIASYVAFELDNGKTFKTASSTAIPFAMQVAKFLGYDPTSGKLPYPIKFVIKLQKAETGYKYNFILKGIVAPE